MDRSFDEERFSGDANVFVASVLLLYYEKNDKRKRVAPDLMVAFGVLKEPLSNTYLLWLEPKGPDFVLEVTSKSTRKRDWGVKRELYERIGVTEYVMFDPKGEFLMPQLQLFRLERGKYATVTPDNDGRYW